MAIVMPRRIGQVARSTDPKTDIMKAVGDLSGLKILGNRILLGTYIRPETTPGGIIRPDANVEEDVFQGKVGLVLKWGVQAYVDDPDYTFTDDDKIQVGEWAVYMVGDAKSITINQYPCRLVRDSSLLLRVTDPNMVF